MPARSPDGPSDEAALRASIVAAGRRLGARGLMSATEGNASVRLTGEQLLITPSGRRKDELRASDLLTVALRKVGPDTAEGRRQPSSDVAIHRAVYAVRPDVGAVIHAHLPAAMALTLAGEVPDPAVLPETALFLPRLPFVPFAAAGSEELAAAIASALSSGPAPLPGAALLERHGAVAVGVGDPLTAIDQALDRLELVEVLCRTWRDALLILAAASGRSGGAILRPPSTGPGASARGSSRRKT